MVLVFGELQNIHVYQRSLFLFDKDEAIPHHKGTGVNAKNYFRSVCQPQSIFAKIYCLNKNTKTILKYGIGLVLFAWLCYLMANQIRHQHNLGLSFQQMRDSFHASGFISLLLVLVLMFVNWGIEAKKWQLLINRLEPISFIRAFRATLAGVSLSIHTPNRVGEYGGRVLYLKNQNKLKGIAVTIVGSFSQMIITIIFGLIGLAYYVYRYAEDAGGQSVIDPRWEKFLLPILIGVCIFVIILYFRLQWIVTLFEKIPILRKVRIFIAIVARYKPRELSILLLLSGIRYIVFSAQYLILLRALGVEVLWWQGFLMNSVVYLALAIIPTFAIAELGVRGQVSLYFIGLLSTNTIGILAAAAAIWFINLFLPAILGIVLLLGVKIFREK